jgi:hypothetical protein
MSLWSIPPSAPVFALVGWEIFDAVPYMRRPNRVVVEAWWYPSEVTPGHDAVPGHMPKPVDQDPSDVHVLVTPTTARDDDARLAVGKSPRGL